MKTICFGTFDILHPGHIDFLNQASKLGNHLTVVIARDCNVEKFKNKTSKDPESIRLLKIRKINVVNQAILGDKHNIYKVIEQNQPDIIALGYDQKADITKLQQKFPDTQIIRLKSFKPHIFKTSILCNISKKA